MRLITSLLVLITTVIGSVGTFAYDFEVDGFYYNIISLPDLTCELTKGDTPYAGDIVIPSTVTYKNRVLSVVKIADAFTSNKKVTSVTIPNSVTEIVKKAFNGCTSLTSVVIPNSVTTINSYTFDSCSSLTSIEIPNSVTAIGEFAFYYCTSLTSIEIPNSVTVIDEKVFKGCSSLTSIEIPNSVTKIGEGAFEGCSSLTSIEIPNSVTKINYHAFYGCSSLTSIEIPNSVTWIGKYAFSGCTSLTSVEIPNSVTDIGGYAFENCNNLNTVHFIGGGDCKPLGWDVLENNNDKYICVSPWKGCENLNNLIIERELNPDKCVKWFNSYLNKWRLMFIYKIQGSSAYNIDISNITFGCKTMPSWGICNETELETITFTDAVEEIEAEALKGCSGLQAIYCQGMTPPNLGSGSFTNEQFLELPVYVPKGSLAAYLAAPEWCNFWELQEYDPESSGINDLRIERPYMTNDIYNMQGVCIKRAATDAEVKALPAGIYIVNGKKLVIR